MILGLLLSCGESIKSMSKTGQDQQFKQHYLKHFAKYFDKIYLLSYEKEKPLHLPKNVICLTNEKNLHRYLFALLAPLIYKKEFSECNTIRAYHLSGTIPALIARLLFGKNFVFNYAYNYKSFALVEKKYFQYILFVLLQPLVFVIAKKILIANKNLINNSHKLVYLPNGVDPTFFKPKTLTKEKSKLILSVGRLESQKNYQNLISALSGSKLKLKIVGRGKLKQELLTLAKKLNIDLEITEKIPNSQMPIIYSKADLFIMPSIIEGHPKALLEAMACTLPVIGTNVQGIKEIIIDKQNGLLCDTNTSSIRGAIETLLNNHVLRKNLSVNARKFVIKNFNLKSLIKAEISAIKSAA